MRHLVITVVTVYIADIGYVPPPGDPYEATYPVPVTTGMKAPQERGQTGILRRGFELPSSTSGFAIWGARDMPGEFQRLFQPFPTPSAKLNIPLGLSYDPAGTLLSVYGFMLKAVEAEFESQEGMYDSQLCRTKSVLLGDLYTTNVLSFWKNKRIELEKLLSNKKLAVDEKYKTVTMIELTSYHPFSIYPFAPGLSLLDREKVRGCVTGLVNNKDKLLSGNAVAWLGENGYYDDLYQILQDGEDLGQTTKIRIIYYLTEARYRGLDKQLAMFISGPASRDNGDLIKLFAIDSLGRIGTKEDLAYLQELLDESIRKRQLDRIYITTKSLIKLSAALNNNDKDTLKNLLLKARIMLLEETPQQDYYVRTIGKATDEIVDFGLAYCGQEGAVERFRRLFRDVYHDVMRSGIYDPVEDGSLRKITYVNRLLFLRLLPYMLKEANVKEFLETLVLSCSEHYRVTQAAISEYIRGEPPDRIADMLPRLIRKLVNGDKNVLAHLLRLASVYSQGAPDTERAADDIIGGYDRGLDHLYKNCVATAIEYLRHSKRLTDSTLARIARDEIKTIQSLRKPDPKKLWRIFYSADFTAMASIVATDRLLETLLTLLVSRKSEYLPDLLKKMIRTRELRLNRMALYYMRYADGMERYLKKGLASRDILSQLISSESLAAVR